MKIEYGYNFIRIECVESEISDSAITVAEDPKFAEYPIIVYCTDTGALYTGAYDDGTVTLAEYGSGSGGGGGGGSDTVYVPISIDYTDPSNPVVTCETALSAILSDLSAGKLVVLTSNPTGYSYYYYPMDYSTADNYCNWYSLGVNPSITIISAEGSEWGYSYTSLQPRQ